MFFYDWEYYRNNLLEILLPFRFNPEFEFTGFQGLASHGAAISMIISMYFYNKKILKKSVLWILDRVVIPVALGAIFVRVGNFFNSEMIGKPADESLPWAIIFKSYDNIPRHPGQLYEAFGYIFVFLTLWFLYWKGKKSKQTGFLFGLFLLPCLLPVYLFGAFPDFLPTTLVDFFPTTLVDFLSVPLLGFLPMDFAKYLLPFIFIFVFRWM